MGFKTEIEIKMDPTFLKRVSVAVRSAVGDAFKDIAVPQARANSPKRSGENANSIWGRVRTRSESRITASMGTESGYGGYIERGTRSLAAHPYIYPAAAQAIEMLPTLIASRLQEFSEGNVTPIPDEVIAAASQRIQAKLGKGVGIVGAKAAREKREGLLPRRTHAFAIRPRYR